MPTPTTNASTAVTPSRAAESVRPRTTAAAAPRLARNNDRLTKDCAVGLQVSSPSPSLGIGSRLPRAGHTGAADARAPRDPGAGGAARRRAGRLDARAVRAARV